MFKNSIIKVVAKSVGFAIVTMLVGNVDGQISPQVRYTVTDLGTLPGGSYSIGNGINNSGQVVGYSSITSGYVHAFLYANGLMKDIGTLPDVSQSCATAINDDGKVVGYSSDNFLYVNGSMQDLGAFENVGAPTLTVPNGINAIGWVVGYGSTTIGQYTELRAFLYTSELITDMNTLISPTSGWMLTDACGINDLGQIVGSGVNRINQSHAFLYWNGNIADLGTLPGGNDSIGNGINNDGKVVGYSSTSRGDIHAFVYANGSMKDLGTLGGGNSYATAINKGGQVVGYSSISSDNARAFLYMDGQMNDLNSLVIGSGWVLRQAKDINDHGLIVGFGINPQGQTHAFLLNPIPAGSIEAIQKHPTQSTYGTLPEKEEGKDSLVVITHGRTPKLPIIGGFFPPEDPTWVDAMSNSIANYLTAHSIHNWQVLGYKWVNDSWRVLPDTSLENAKQHGVDIGHQILASGYTHVHFIAHSAGAGLIQAATDVIKNHTTGNPAVVVHETFLDPYVGTGFSGTGHYGESANWADNYSAKDDETGNEILPFTYNILSHSYNVDVTYIDVNDRVQRPHFVSGSGSPCYVTKSVHIWPVNFYSNTIVGAVTSEYDGFGFPLSEEGSMWSTALSYTKGNKAPGHILGTADPACFFDIPALTYPAIPTDFLNMPSLQSDTGTIEKYANASVKHKTGSPSWLATFITVTNPANAVAFDAEFQSTNGGAQGLLSVYWDADTIGSIDERVVQAGFQHYTFKFPTTASYSLHMLGFRLDPFTNIQSVSVLTNVVTTASGVTQPFSLAITGGTGGSSVYQLTGQPGFDYTIQASSDLTNSASWTNIAILANTNGTVQFFDQDSTNHYKRFYRAVAPY